jgi:hypothetical protein
MRALLAGCVLLVALAACGNDVTTSTTAVPAATTTTTSPPTTTSPSSAEPLASYGFTVSLSVVPDEGAPRLVEVLDGEAVVETGAMRIFGILAGLPIDLVTDGVTWQDLEQPDLELDATGVRDFLVLTGMLMPDYVSDLFEDTAAWEDLGTEPHLGAPATHLRRRGIEKGIDWDYGDVAEMNVWRDLETGVIVKLTALFATGDNEGFPLATWEVVERNPGVEIPKPGA